MKGINHYYRTTAPFTEFVAHAQALNLIGGTLFYWLDGEGVVVEPDCTENIKMDLGTRELVYKSN